MSVFVEAAREEIKLLQKGPMREALKFLLKHAVGRDNAVSLSYIVGYLGKIGYLMSVHRFQQTILKDTRLGRIFIASCSKGMYLVKDVNDAQPMIAFYRERIAAETTNLNRFMSLVNELR